MSVCLSVVLRFVRKAPETGCMLHIAVLPACHRVVELQRLREIRGAGQGDAPMKDRSLPGVGKI